MIPVLFFCLALLTLFFLSFVVVTARRFDKLEVSIRASMAGKLLTTEEAVHRSGGLPTPSPPRAPHASVGDSPWCAECKLARDHPLHLLYRS